MSYNTIQYNTKFVKRHVAVASIVPLMQLAPYHFTFLASPTVWNVLSEIVTFSSATDDYKRHSKAHLFIYSESWGQNYFVACFFWLVLLSLRWGN